MDGSKVMAKLAILVILGEFLTPLTPRGSKIRFYPGSRVLNICVYQYCLTFGRVPEKLNGWIKRFGAKIALLVILGLFFEPFDPLNLRNQIFPKIRSTRLMCILTLSNFL